MKLSNFLLKREEIEGFEKISIKDKQTNNAFSCIPAIDAMLSGLTLMHHDLAVPLIRDIVTTDDLGQAISIYSGIILFPFPNRLNQGKYVHNSKSYQFPLNEVERSNNLHATLKKPFSVQNIDLEKGSITLVYCHTCGASEFPFDAQLEVKYTLQKNGLDVRMKLTNHQHETIPVGIGSHPYFQFGTTVDNLLMELPASKFALVDEDLIPTGHFAIEDSFSKLHLINDTELDNCFVGERGGRTHIYVPNIDMHFYLQQDLATLPYVHVFIASTRDCIAIEPVSCMPDAFNNGIGLVHLEPNEVMETGYTVNIE